MELWFTEIQKPGMGITCKVYQTLHTEQSPYQHIAILDTVQFGRMLTLDGIVMCTLMDEFAYHEMLAHVPLFTHPAPKDVLIIGGGDGGTAREVLRHNYLNSVTLVELDQRVTEVCKRYLPELACSFDNPRLEARFEDGVKFMQTKKSCYDIILIDAPDPIGQAARLFGLEFYQSIYQALRPDGIFAAQTESPFVDAELISRVTLDVHKVFPVTKLYLSCVPTYPTALWSFTMGSKKYDPLQNRRECDFLDQLKYYNPEIHQAAFSLPTFIKKLLPQGV